MDPNQISCVSCQSVTTNDGKTVWVCENCHTVNTPSMEDQLGVQTPTASTDVAPAQMPSGATSDVAATPTPQVVDTTAAQAALDEAAAMAAASPITVVPEVPVTPVSPQVQAQASSMPVETPAVNPNSSVPPTTQ